ncbi:MAG: transpeptidase family protein [Spirochaetes bacterium]|nr:transpeptidase family protein [Spirochaetota bacterium]
MNQTAFKRRVYIAGFFFALLSLGFIVRLFNLHFSPRVVLPEDSKPEARRGVIRDRNGFILALSIESHSLFVNPEEIRDPEGTARAVARVLGVTPEGLLEKLKKKRRFIWIRRKMDDDQAGAIRKLGLPGLHFKKEYRRVYPHEGLASNVIGFVGVDNEGLAGIEYSFEAALSGEEGGFRREADGLIFGRNINLAIDRYIQEKAEREIEKAVARHGAKQGSVVVMEVKTGRILAMAKSPGFDPNRFHVYSPFDLRNFSFIDSYEPGSTMKIISLASILTHRPSVAGKSFNCTGYIDIADVRINCTGIHGTLGMKDVIRHSCNVGVIKAMRGIRKKDLFATLETFRFGRKTGLELPGETEGILRPVEKWSGLSKYSIGIGQEISVTSVQLAAAFSAIANGGVYVAPTIIETIEEHDGVRIRNFAPAVKGRVVTEAMAKDLIGMMRGVVEGGTGAAARSPHFCVAGKTGTSQKFVRAKGYSDRVLASFIGVAPCEDPVVCVLVIIDDPADRQSGGRIAAPVFGRLIDPILIRLGAGAPMIRAETPVQRPPEKPVFDGKTMPDFNGKRLPEALDLLLEMRRKAGVRYAIRGTGRVFEQRPAPGTLLNDGDEVLLFFAE